MACLNEEDFLECLYSLYAVGTIRGSRKGLPDILKRNDRMERAEFMFRTKWCVAAIKWQDNKSVTVLSTYHIPGDDLWSQASHFGEVERQRWYVIDYSLPHRSFRVQCNNGRGRSLRPEMRYAIGRRSLEWWHRLLYFLIDLAIVNSFIMWDWNNGGQRDQLPFRLALVRQLIVGRETKRRWSDLLTKGKPGVSGVPDDMRLWEVGKYLPVRSTRRRCRQCSIRKHEARTNMMCSHCKVPLCVHTCFEKFHRKYLPSYNKV